MNNLPHYIIGTIIPNSKEILQNIYKLECKDNIQLYNEDKSVVFILTTDNINDITHVKIYCKGHYPGYKQLIESLLYVIALDCNTSALTTSSNTDFIYPMDYLNLTASEFGNEYYHEKQVNIFQIK